MNQNPNHSTLPASELIKIDGAAVRRLREEQGLTQLYLATVIGVTTDTISRWENRRYPAVKKENALALAQAFGVDLEEILEQQQQQELEPKDEPKAEKSSPSRAGLFTSLGLLSVIVLIFIAWLYSFQKQPALLASRYLPPHTPAGWPIPVVISVSGEVTKPFTLIVSETIPEGTTVQACLPQPAQGAAGDRSFKWITRMERSPMIFAYLLKPDPSLARGTRLEIRGTITSRAQGKPAAIKGGSSFEVAPFHWADGNRDSLIDDEEILSVYDALSGIADVPVNREVIENLWAGGPYQWDPEKGEFLVGITSGQDKGD